MNTCPETPLQDCIRQALAMMRKDRFDDAYEYLADAIGEQPFKNRDVNRMANPVLLKRRIRFFVRVAKTHNIRLSALVFFIAVHTRRQFQQGRWGKLAGWHSTAADLGGKIDVSRWEVYRLLKEAKAAKLLGFERTARGILVWVGDRTLYKDIARNDSATTTIGHFYRPLARLLGINASILYKFIKVYSIDDTGCLRSPLGFAYELPWMNPESIRHDLATLLRLGLIRRERDRGIHTSVRWRYVWRPRTSEDRKKWQTYVLSLKSEADRKKCQRSGGNGNSKEKEPTRTGRNCNPKEP